MARRRHFGKARRLPSGRWQASYIDAGSGRRINAPNTFANKTDAALWLSSVETDLSRGDLLDVEATHVTLAEYADAWFAAKKSLRPKTRELYEYLLRLHILPALGRRKVTQVTAADVRAWHGNLVASGLSETTAAKAYRLVRQIFEAAVDDRLRRDNPCRVKGAATERSVERQIPSLEQVAALADGIAPRYRAMVLVAALAGLRKGECLGLARRHLDLTAEPPIVRIERALVYTDAGPIMQEPKTTAGHRTLALPPILVDELNEHLAAFVAPAADALLFTDAKTGASPRKDRIRWEWVLACRAAGVECSFHDLRHVAGTLNAAAGATIKEAMARLGHASPVAALRYQHAVQSRDAEIAAAVGNIALPALGSRRSPGGHVQPTS